jgi:hypothetical protein
MAACERCVRAAPRRRMPVRRLLDEKKVAPAQLTLRQIAHALLGRGDVDPGGPSDFDILEPLEKTNTMSYDDFVKITAHCEKHSDEESVVEVGWADGQSVIGLKNLKKRWPLRYAKWVLGVGGFHEHAHTMFAITTMFWLCYLCWCLAFLGIERVLPVTKNLEHNAYSHHQNAHHIVMLGTLAFLVQDVVNPPPALLFRLGIDVYLQYVASAGGIVLCRYLQYGGFPVVQWQRTARDAAYEKVVPLFAYSFHLYRSVAHKPVAAQIALIALLSYCCVLPAVQAVLYATFALGLLGRLSACMYTDRVLESVNQQQQGTKGNASATSFRKALDMTTLLRTMMHVRHAFQAAERGSERSDEPVTESMLVQARLLQNELRRVLGTDLTILDPNNPFWHSGNLTPLDQGDFRERRPWEWVWRVAEGRSAGHGRARMERWNVYVRRFVHGRFFAF